jgi:transcriptional regulator with XRE-family HTH domain
MRRVRAGADPATRVGASYARRHLRQLEAAGMTRSEVARRAGLSAGTISRLADPSTHRVSRISAAAVMAVTA